MKKIITLIFILAMAFNTLGNAAFAQTGDPNLFEALDNLQKLSSYSTQQLVTGNMVVNMGVDKKGMGNMTLMVKSSMVNHGSYKSDSKTSVDGKIHVALEGADRPFSDLDARFRLSVIALMDGGTYVRLENADVSANGIPEKDQKSYLDFKDEMANAMAPILWQWIEIPDGTLKEVTQNAPSDLGSLDVEALKADLIKNGFKNMIRKEIDNQIATRVKDGSMTQAEADKSKTVVDLLFKTKFFDLKNLKRPGQEEQTSFSLNKNRILEFLQGTAKTMGESITGQDLNMIKNALRKLSLSGSFQLNPEFRIFDRLRLRLNLRSINELTSFQMGYTMKISKINDVEAIKAPAKSITPDEANLGFLVPPASTIDTEPMLEPLPTDGY